MIRPRVQPILAALTALNFLLAACGERPVLGQCRILCLGDSITESSYGSYVRPLRRMFKGRFPPVQVLAASRPGFNSGEYLAFLRHDPVLEKIKPDMVLLMIGTNDVRIDGDRTVLADYQSNLDQMIDLLARAKNRKGTKPAILLATIPPIFHSDLSVFDESSSRRIRAEVNPAIRRIARERSLVLVDMEGAFVGHPELIPGVHPDARGYKKIAEVFFSAIESLLKIAP